MPSDLVAEVIYKEERGRKRRRWQTVWRYEGKGSFAQSQAVDVTTIMNVGQSSPSHLRKRKAPGRNF